MHRRDGRIQLAWCSVLHIINDGYLAALSLLLPFIAADLGLSYTQSGLLKSACHTAISAAQIPAGLLAEKTGAILLLGLGSAWFSAGFIAILFAFGFSSLLVLILVSGIGGGVYHPVGTALVSNISKPENSGSAVGILNFFGDLGKVAFPALAGVLVIQVGWRGTFAALGGIGLAASVCFLLAFRKRLYPRRGDESHHSDHSLPAASDRPVEKKNSPLWGVRDGRQFTLFTVIGMIDISIRSAVMAFLGFYLFQSGVLEQSLGLLLSLTFFGGAFGKLLCGMPIALLGVKRMVFITEFFMVAGCFALPFVPSGWSMYLFLPLFGFFLNGTSSVLYIGLIPTLAEDFRSRGYAFFFTLNFLFAAISPYLFGIIADAWGLAAVFFVAGLVMSGGLSVVGLLRNR